VSKTRRIVSFVLALALTVAGLISRVWFLFGAHVYSFKLASASGLVLGVGVLWLYSDFIDATPNDQDQRGSKQ
jgi:hypothetical protein